jgi:hemerythrin
MQNIVWKEEYCIGIDEIDRQHMDFVKLINRFIILFESGSNIRLQDRILLEIVKYFEYHCISEENLMIISHYPRIDIQTDAHKQLIKSVYHKAVGLKEGMVNGTDIINFLIRWFMNHTQEEDRKFATYIKEQSNARKTISDSE